MFTEERALWLYQHYLWLEAHLPKRTEEFTPPLILPTPEFYPLRNTRDHAFAQATFDRTRELMGIAEWTCELVAQTDDERAAADAVARAAPYLETRYNSAAGTFSAQEGVVRITYSPSLLRDPSNLVATFVHELCHYLMATFKEEPPAGWKEHEPLTDLAAVHEGFGVFLCNTAFHFSQWSTATHGGWQTSSKGYLKEPELAFATAVFCVRNGIDPELAMAHLKMNPAEIFWDSIGYVEDLEAKQ